MNNIKYYTFEKSKSGETVPAVTLPDGNAQAIHSMIDPKHEARRLVSQIAADTGFLIFLGLGGGFAPEAALELTGAQIIVIDFNSDGIAQLLANKDYSKLLKSKRFTLLVDLQSDDIKKFILENYRPSLAGGIKVIPLRTRIEQDREKFEKTSEVIQEAIEVITGDYSVQAHFGIHWFSNIIRNIKNIDKLSEYNIVTPQTDTSKFSNTSLCDFSLISKKPVKEAAVIAAGPSLDIQIEYLAKLKSKNVFIICSDTALGVLIHNGIEPDAVVSIDCQHISYYHFMGKELRKKLQSIPLILDIASPPLLCGLSASVIFFASGHPLAQYLKTEWRPLAQLDTSGGNVTYSCLSLAETLGAQRITFFGADFSYIGSQSYARGTYINPYFSRRQNRTAPIEAQMSSFLYRSPFLPPELPAAAGEIKNYYETSSLRSYRKKLEAKASLMAAHIECAKGFGAPIKLNKEQGAENKKCEMKNVEYGKKSDNNYLSGIEFLKKYRDDIAALPEAKDSGCYFETLNSKEKQVFTSLLPFAAAIRKRNNDLSSKDIIRETKRRGIAEIDAVL